MGLAERHLREARHVVRQRVGLLEPLGGPGCLHEVDRWLSAWRDARCLAFQGSSLPLWSLAAVEAHQFAVASQIAQPSTGVFAERGCRAAQKMHRLVPVFL